MVWLVYPLTTIVPNYSAFRKRNRRFFDRELLRQARRRLATLRSWQLFGHMYTRPKELTELRPPVLSRSVGADITLESSEQMPKYLDR
jgi:hypothetical protein